MSPIRTNFLKRKRGSITPPPPRKVLGNVDGTVMMAFGLRKLYADYTGPCIRVKVGTTETDIGFTGNNLNRTAIAALGADVQVVKWYDQSGLGRDLLPAYPATPPLIRRAGVTEPGIVGLQNQCFLLPAGIYGQLTSASYHSVFAQVSGNAGSILLRAGSFITHTPFSDGNNYTSFLTNTRATIPWVPKNLLAFSAVGARVNASSLESYRNGVLMGSSPQGIDNSVIVGEFPDCGDGATMVAELVMFSDYIPLASFVTMANSASTAYSFTL